MEALGPYSLALALTLGIEIPIVILLSGRALRRPILQVAVCANLFTHPLANWAHAEGLLPFLPLELLVFAAEATIYATAGGLRPVRAVALALLANALTAALSFTI